ncbi:MAG: ECF transporter S component [Eubacteriales bacterium]
MNSSVKTQNKLSTKMLVYCALLIALSFVGAQIKITASIALDALPAFFGALLLGPVAGAFVGALGHILTAATSGFLFTVPVHLIIALCMAGICFIFGYLKNRIHIIINSVIAILLNGVVLLFISAVAMQWLGIIPVIMETFLALVGPLTLGAAINVIIGALLYRLVKDKISL